MILRLFDYFRTHVALRWGIFSVLTLMLLFSFSRLSYKEDISDFLPLGTEDREALSIFQGISGADQVIVIFDNPDDEEMTANAIEAFCDSVCENDTLGLEDNIIAKFDIEELTRITDFVYSNIPYFLEEKDYAHMDSVLATPDYIPEQLRGDYEMLMFPSGGLLSQNISRDPLNLFTPVVSRLNKSQTNSHFESYEGYIFSPDMKKAIVMVSSPFGNSETENNAKLVRQLEEGLAKMQKEYPEVKAHLTGGPCIAVSNANQIKHDSIIAISISLILIVLLLAYSFRSLRNIALIIITIAWGGLFALGCISLIHNNISIIVLGISSIIIGIAVNYPLHLIDHTNHEPNIRNSLKDIVTPLVVGNVTTIGAFMALVPLKSVALRDLGLFASLLLLGTIAFVLVFLPHWLKVRKTAEHQGKLFRMLTETRMENKRWLIAVVMILTVIFGYFSLKTEFDANMSNINFMTEQQKSDMNYFQSLLQSGNNDSIETLYVVSSASTMDEALKDSRKKNASIDSLYINNKVSGKETASSFISSKEEQERRLARWNEFVTDHQELLKGQLKSNATRMGFNSEAFTDFDEIIDGEYAPKNYDDFSILTKTVFKGNFNEDKLQERYSVVDKVLVKTHDLEAVKAKFQGSFDVKSMNSAIANSLSNDFNYIGFACSAIVFIFLWLSFGRLELAVIAFLPMAISWIWILGLMYIFGIKFNIVNVILATFIFGQGDDYTIFITEGCIHEYAYKKPMLASYKNSIILSALIMFVGIGSLIVAKHPALLSLAEVTIIGMFSVVLMAYLIPPLLFKWLTEYKERRALEKAAFEPGKPLSSSAAVRLVKDRYLYKGSGVYAAVRKALRKENLEWADSFTEGDQIVISNRGCGALALYAALVHPDLTVVACEEDENDRLLAQNSASSLASNLIITETPQI